MKKDLVYLTLFALTFGCGTAVADDMDAMLFEPAPKITAAPKKPKAPAKTSIAPSVDGGIIMKPEAISDAEFESIEEALPVEQEIAARKNTSIQPPKTTSSKNKQQSLTDAIKETAEEEGAESPLAGTWVEKLATTALSSADKEDSDEIGGEKVGSINLEGMVNNSRNNNRRSNASVFDISGLMLRMNLPQAEATMLKRGFKKVSQKFEIPNFIKWRFE